VTAHSRAYSKAYSRASVKAQVKTLFIALRIASRIARHIASCIASHIACFKPPSKARVEARLKAPFKTPLKTRFTASLNASQRASPQATPICGFSATRQCLTDREHVSYARLARVTKPSVLFALLLDSKSVRPRGLDYARCAHNILTDARPSPAAVRRLRRCSELRPQVLT